MLAILLPLFLGAFKRVGGIVDWLFETKAGRICLLVLVCAIGLLVWTKHVEHQATAAAVAKEQAATAAEHDRREKVLTWAQQWAAGAIKNVDGLNAKNADLQKRLAAAIAHHADVACLPADVV